MNPKELKNYRKDAMFGALGAFLMLVGDLCLSVIPASPGDSGLFAREAYMNGSWAGRRMQLLLATGICGMALVFLPCAFPGDRYSRSTAGPERLLLQAV